MDTCVFNKCQLIDQFSLSDPNVLYVPHIDCLEKCVDLSIGILENAISHVLYT